MTIWIFGAKVINEGLITLILFFTSFIYNKQVFLTIFLSSLQLSFVYLRVSFFPAFTFIIFSSTHLSSIMSQSTELSVQEGMLLFYSCVFLFECIELWGESWWKVLIFTESLGLDEWGGSSLCFFMEFNSFFPLCFGELWEFFWV